MMMLRRLLVPGGILVAAIALATATALAASPGAPDPASTVCASCHDQARAFVSNPHLQQKGKEAEAICASCHGDGTAHAEAGGEKTKIVRPTGRAGAEICLGCHDATSATSTTSANSAHASFRNGVHAQDEAVNCLSCHTIHAADPKERHLLKANPSALCATCHADVAASFRNKPYAHKIGRAGMECSSCHDPHGLPQKALRMTRAEEMPCLSCHAEKRGPFVYEHPGGGTATCVTCHEPHGSSNPKRIIRANVYQLCLECHSPTGGALGAQPPSFHNLLTARHRNCTTCHVAIHGSNRSPRLLK
jgi:DmsE family decaheme c-type cytochrome